MLVERGDTFVSLKVHDLSEEEFGHFCIVSLVLRANPNYQKWRKTPATIVQWLAPCVMDWKVTGFDSHNSHRNFSDSSRLLPRVMCYGLFGKTGNMRSSFIHITHAILKALLKLPADQHCRCLYLLGLVDARTLLWKEILSTSLSRCLTHTHKHKHTFTHTHSHTQSPSDETINQGPMCKRTQNILHTCYILFRFS